MQFQCESNFCILSSYICDGVVDCNDEVDEVNCAGISSVTDAIHQAGISELYPVYTCADIYYACLSGQCIPLSHMCDGEHDCTDTTDEVMCSSITNRHSVVPSIIKFNSAKRVCSIAKVDVVSRK